MSHHERNSIVTMLQDVTWGDTPDEIANVSVELKVWQNMVHCFELFAPVLAEGRFSINEAGAFLNHHFKS
ncbi:MAG: hypothetical protein AAFY72_01315 [Cyanobacteria bacterium J06649_4]